jgi:hypothetical protein
LFVLRLSWLLGFGTLQPWLCLLRLLRRRLLLRRGHLDDLRLRLWLRHGPNLGFVLRLSFGLVPSLIVGLKPGLILCL